LKKRGAASALGVANSEGASPAKDTVEIATKPVFRKFRREVEFGPSLTLPPLLFES
jgi:hypothetical protein